MSATLIFGIISLVVFIPIVACKPGKSLFSCEGK